MNSLCPLRTLLHAQRLELVRDRGDLLGFLPRSGEQGKLAKVFLRFLTSVFVVGANKGDDGGPFAGFVGLEILKGFSQ